MITYTKKKKERIAKVYKASTMGQGELEDGEAALLGPDCEQNWQALTKRKECPGRSVFYLFSSVG